MNNEAAKRVARRAKDRARRAQARFMKNNARAFAAAAARAANPDPSNCTHCGAEWGVLCPCTPAGLARLLAWEPGTPEPTV